MAPGMYVGVDMNNKRKSGYLGVAMPMGCLGGDDWGGGQGKHMSERMYWVVEAG